MKHTVNTHAHKTFGLSKNVKFISSGSHVPFCSSPSPSRHPEELASNEHLSCARHCYFSSLARKYRGFHFLGQVSQKDGVCPPSERRGDSWDVLATPLTALIFRVGPCAARDRSAEGRISSLCHAEDRDELLPCGHTVQKSKLLLALIPHPTVLENMNN